MKMLFYNICAHLTTHTGIMLDEAYLQNDLGHEVVFISCSSIIGNCFLNSQEKKSICYSCQCKNNHNLKLLPKSIRMYDISKYITSDLLDNCKNVRYSYNNVNSIKAIKYKDLYLGYGALSNYITITRNCNPLVDNDFVKYFDKILHKGILLYEALVKAVKEECPDRIYIFNGRLLETRILYDYAKAHNIEVYCMEGSAVINGIQRKTVFENSIPHDIYNITERIDKYWRNPAISEEEKKKIGVSFYENRRASRPAGDKVYTKNQESGLLPSNWDVKYENVVIFNSSEDEFASTSHEYDNMNLFDSQLQGIKVILEEYRNDQSKHFYIRIHPNLSSIKYKYYTDIYKLKYENLTVIGPEEKVSTYALIDAANKIVVFGSTVGIEASYSNKPVILLAGAAYSFLNVTYNPKSLEELKALLDTENLSPKRNIDNIVKYGYYVINELDNMPYKINFLAVKKRFFGRVLECCYYNKILNSTSIYLLYNYCLSHMLKFIYREKKTSIPSKDV